MRTGELDVQASLVRWLVISGWSVQRNTHVEAHRRGEWLHVEVQGYPAGPAAVPPSLHARTWFAGGLLKALQLRQRFPDDGVAIGLPDFPCYRSLLEGVEDTFWAMRLQVLLVCRQGEIEQWRRRSLSG
ncbi:hypothetical protein [Umezawaea beigongshangensis]|uniref:hypothetical protein n=1 Tax=Umezawaea beigongshangensis TaxID=2780383 RepID=UPI0018F230A0|nr:hypothetical protein [Umezawaea beigongshangensis]